MPMDNTVLLLIADTESTMINMCNGAPQQATMQDWFDSTEHAEGYRKYLVSASGARWRRLSGVGDIAPDQFQFKNKQIIVDTFTKEVGISLRDLKNLQSIVGTPFMQQLNGVGDELAQEIDLEVTRVLADNPTDVLGSALFGSNKDVFGKVKLTNVAPSCPKTVAGIRTWFYAMTKTFKNMKKPNGLPYHPVNVENVKFRILHSGKYTELLERAFGINVDAASEPNAVKNRVELQSNSFFGEVGLDEYMFISPIGLPRIAPPVLRVTRGGVTVYNNMPQGGFTDSEVMRKKMVTFQAEIEQEFDAGNPWASVRAVFR